MRKTSFNHITACLAFILMSVTALARPVRMFDAEQLSSNLVTSICQDGMGYLWIGTEYGLNKFDGVYVTQYYSDDTRPETLDDDIIRHVMAGRDGSVWVITNLGVQRYNALADSFESVSFGSGGTANVNDLLQTPEGKVLLLHAQEGVFELDGMKALPMDDVNRHLAAECDNMYYDSKGRLWIAYKDRGLLMIDTHTMEPRLFDMGVFGVSRVADIVEDVSGRLVVATYTSLQQFNENTLDFETVVSFPRNQITCLFSSRSGKMLVGTSGSGIWEADFGNASLQPFILAGAEDIDLSSAKVYTCAEDREGNCWLGCYQKGVVGISVKETAFSFLPLKRIQGNNGAMLRYVFSDRRGRTCVCQERGGVKVIDNEGQALAQWMGGYTVMTLKEDADGIFWAGTYRDGLFRIDPDTGHEKWVEQSGRRRISSITWDKEGNIYAAVFGEGLSSYSPDGFDERPLGGGSLALTNPYLNTIFTDSDGLVWIGHYYGIDVYDPSTDSLLDLGVPEALRPAVVYQIGQSPYDGSVWVGSNKGFFQYHTQGEEKGRWRRFTTSEGLPNNIVNSFAICPDGTIWAGTYRGLAQIDTIGRFTRYYRGDGLQEWSYLRGVSAISPDGEVFLGNQNGITHFLPGTIHRDSFKEGITLTAMRLGDSFVNASSLSGGKSIITGALEKAEEITVSYQDNTFSLRFSPMDFRDPQSIHYEFRFADEARDQWYQTESGRSEIFFSHLSPGRHALIVRAYDNGVYSPEKQILINVRPPWYRTWWAYICYILLILGIIALWQLNYRSRKQAETNEDKIKFFVDISHELRSPLTLIKSPLSQLLASDHDAQTTRALRNMERNTNRLLALTNQILSLRKMEKGQMTLHYAETALADFVSDICHDYEFQAEKRKVTLNFTDEASGLKVWIDRDNFDKVVTNLINNAIKYTGENGVIDVTVREGADCRSAELLVSDNGPGIEEAQLKRIFDRFYQTSARPAAGQMSYGIGLNLTQKIVALHGGSISAHNRADVQGSVFAVRLPLGSGHLPQDQLVGEEYFGVQAAPSRSLPVTDVAAPRKARKKTTYRIAVVDDDDEIRSFLETELGETYHVFSYPDGQKALEGIVENVPDLVVSDVMMPATDGVELLKRLKSSTVTSHIPVILLTTKTEHESRIKGLEEGADAYVDKPFNLEELETRISGLIANRVRMKGKFSGVQEQQDTVRQIQLKGNDASLMEKIMKAVNERLDDSEFNVEALADTVGLSRVQLHRRVKEITGITVGEFIRNIRLQQAARLLEEGDTTVSQVTYAVGFANPTHFSSAFKKHFGVTPSEYLSKHQNKRS